MPTGIDTPVRRQREQFLTEFSMPMSTTERARIAGRARAASQTPEQRKELASQGYLSAAVKAIVARAPELTPDQVSQLRAAFGAR